MDEAHLQYLQCLPQRPVCSVSAKVRSAFLACPAALATWAISLAMAWAAWVVALAWEGLRASGSSAWEAYPAWTLAWEAVAAAGELERLLHAPCHWPAMSPLMEDTACPSPRRQHPLPCMLCSRTENADAEAGTVDTTCCN